MSHSIKVKTSAKTEFASPLPSHEAVTLSPFYSIMLYTWTQKCNSHLAKLSRKRQIFDTSSMYSKFFNFSWEKTRKSQQFWPKNENGGCFTQKNVIIKNCYKLFFLQKMANRPKGCLQKQTANGMKPKIWRLLFT